MATSKGSPGRSERHSREARQSQRKGVAGLFYAETATANDDVKVQKRGGTITQWARCFVPVQDTEHAFEDLFDHLKLVYRSSSI